MVAKIWSMNCTRAILYPETVILYTKHKSYYTKESIIKYGCML